MEKRIKAGLITLAVLLVLSISIGVTFIFLWGKSTAEAKELKAAKEAYLQLSHEQDSIINARGAHILILTDSIDRLVTGAIAVNDGTAVTQDEIDKDKQRMNEEINNVPSLSVDSQLRLFSKQSEEYRPR